MDFASTTNSFIGEEFSSLKGINDKLVSKEFEQCTFKNCSFSECTFSKCMFIDCVFEDCHFSLVKFTGSTFLETVFKKSKFVGIDWSKTDSTRNLQFIDCELAHSGFSFMKVPNLVLKNSIAKEVDFMEADCSDANFEGTDFEKSKFHQTNLTKANFNNAFNYAIDFNNNTLKGAKFSMPEAVSLLRGLDIVLKDNF